MTFQDQVKFALKWGALAMALSCASLLVAKFAVGFEPIESVLRMLGWPLLSVGAALFLGGGMIRPFQKWQYHTYWEHSAWTGLMFFRQIAIGRWFLWLDVDGQDRDA